MLLGAGGVIGGGAYYYENVYGKGDMAPANGQYIAYGIALAGVLLYYYGQRGGSALPPYVEWSVPKVLDRASYVRQATEEYNEKHGVKSTEDQPGSVENSVKGPAKHRPRRAQ
jgi:hypothetical protein